jgi:formyl-CoA transferase
LQDVEPSTMEQDQVPATGGVLAGVRVVELGQFLAGPFAGHLLADFGAEVIKVEQPGRGDPMRDWGHHRYKGRALWWPSVARNKKAVSLNLRVPRGQQLLAELLQHADALVENFRPGTLEQWGLGPDTLHEMNQGLVIARVSGYGQTGPYADRVGFASAGEALGGLRYLNGFPGEAPPRTGISLGDSLAGMFAVQGILAALYQRDVLGLGKGQVVDVSIMEACFALLESTVTEYDVLKVIREPSGTGLKNVAPSNIYKSGDAKWMVIAANADTLFRRLCQAMGQPELADDPRFSTHAQRGINSDELDDIVSGWAGKHTAEEIDKILSEHGVVVSPIYNAADIACDPHYKAREMILRVNDPHLGDIAVPGFVPKFQTTPGVHRWTGPAEIGQHNEEILGELLGIPADELAVLRSEGVI